MVKTMTTTNSGAAIAVLVLLAGCDPDGRIDESFFRLSDDAAEICDASFFSQMDLECTWSVSCGQAPLGPAPSSSGYYDGSGIAGRDSSFLRIGGPWGGRVFLPVPSQGFSTGSTGVFWAIDGIPFISCSLDSVNSQIDFNPDTDHVVYWIARDGSGSVGTPTLVGSSPGTFAGFSGLSLAQGPDRDAYLTWWLYSAPSASGAVDSVWFSSVEDVWLRSRSDSTSQPRAAWVSSFVHDVDSTATPSGQKHQTLVWDASCPSPSGCATRVGHHLFGGAIGLRHE